MKNRPKLFFLYNFWLNEGSLSPFHVDPIDSIYIFPQKKSCHFFRGLVNDEKNTKIWFGSSILVTITHVLTADHCLWLEKPRNWAFNEPGEKGKLLYEVNFK